MNASTHRTDYQASLPVHIVCTRGQEGEACYFVLRTSAARFQQLLAKKERGQVNIADYGEILASGYGDTPTPHVLLMLKQRYGIDLSA